MLISIYIPLPILEEQGNFPFTFSKKYSDKEKKKKHICCNIRISIDLEDVLIALAQVR